MDEPQGMQQIETRPTPDPTILTTEQLLREVERVKELAASNSQRLQEVFIEKFASVDKQFVLIERQRVEQKEDTKTAVDAALNAAKEAVKEQTAASEKSITKSETSTAEQLKQLTVTFETAIRGVTAIQDDLKERVGKIESRKEGGTELSKTLMTLGGLLLTVILVIATLAALTHGFSR